MSRDSAAAAVRRAMESLELSRDALFVRQEREVFPPQFHVSALLRDNEADVDVIVAAHGTPELTRLAVASYLMRERGLRVHIVVVDSGREPALDLMSDERVSLALVRSDDVEVHPSQGMAAASAIGASLGRASLVFFSHSDMLAVGDDPISYLASQLSDGARIAAFTQRHVIPFSGAMLVDRAVLEEPDVDWLAILDDNPFLAGTGLAPMAAAIPELAFVDCGEQLIYAELAAGRPVVVGPSRGGSGDWWRDPLDYYDTPADDLRRAVADAGVPIRYRRIPIDRAIFARKNPALLPPRRRLWREVAVRWRYGIDDEGRPLFVHHGRGSSRSSLRAWRRLAKAVV